MYIDGFIGGHTRKLDFRCTFSSMYVSNTIFQFVYRSYYKKQAEWVDEIVAVDRLFKRHPTITQVPPLSNEPTQIILHEGPYPDTDTPPIDGVPVCSTHGEPQVAIQTNQDNDNLSIDEAYLRSKKGALLAKILLLVNVVCPYSY